MTAPDPQKANGGLDPAICTAITEAVEDAKRRGWAQIDLVRWFGERAVTLQA